jgi:hypothetical protein
MYREAAAQAGLSWNIYVCSVLAQAHGLDPVGEQREIMPQLPLDDGQEDEREDTAA